MVHFSTCSTYNICPVQWVSAACCGGVCTCMPPCAALDCPAYRTSRLRRLPDDLPHSRSQPRSDVHRRIVLRVASRQCESRIVFVSFLKTAVDTIRQSGRTGTVIESVDRKVRVRMEFDSPRRASRSAPRQSIGRVGSPRERRGARCTRGTHVCHLCGIAWPVVPRPPRVGDLVWVWLGSARFSFVSPFRGPQRRGSQSEYS